MAENRRRFRNKKRDDGRPGPSPTTPVTIARREESRTPVVQPKILLKKEAESNAGSGSSGSNNELPTSIKTIIINRSDARNSHSERNAFPGANTMNNTSSVCAALSSSTCAKEKTNGTGTGTTSSSSSTVTLAGQQESLAPPRMTRPTPLLVANGVFNANARKLFHKSNTDFAVIGVLGAQSVGKSTLLNLLAAERSSDYDYYQHLFGPEAAECTFATRPRAKPQPASNSSASGCAAASKQVLRPRTETLQFFITRERYVLLDTAPMLSGSTAKEADYLDLQTLSTMMQLLSVCHVLLLALDEISLEQLRLLHAALRLRPRTPCKGYVRDYLPQLLFVRTRAQRQDYEPASRERLDRQLELLFEGTGLPIYRGRGEARTLNSMLLPEFNGNAAVVHHAGAAELVRQFRERVFGMVRVSMCQSNDFSETLWFEMLAETARKCAASSQNFEQIYAEIKLRHLELRPKWRPESNWRNES
ncbi:protein SMG9 [Drosophila novamexicana]|uniref:protein SMG9 n=1 Tax=Drosophila novamexicana TaxID=47314 RepID=UPI0011E5AAA5|nr:protein SMG9 [Drosophila novamexicana]